MSLPQGVEIKAPIKPGFDQILTADALALVARLHRAFNARRKELLAARVERAKRLDAGERPDFSPRPGTSATATGRSRRCPPTCSAGAWRSPAPWSAR